LDVAAADLADAAGRPIAMDARIRPVWHGARAAGPAATVAVQARDNLGVRELIEQAPPGAVLVVSGGGIVDCALLGGNLCRCALERELAGAVVDGAIRDVAEIEELRFPVFAAGVVPTRPSADDLGRIGVPVPCGSLTVEPGDFVCGDADGVVVVPAAEWESVRARLGRTSRSS